MIDALATALLIPYALLLLALFVYGLDFFYLIAQGWRLNSPDPPTPELKAPATVTVQVPIFNERFVAERAIDAVAALRWPRDLLDIQILDDSTDDTRAIVAARVNHWQAQGVNITQVTRDNRDGYKAGALAHGTSLSRARYLAVFDADFVPPPDFLERTIPHLEADRKLAFVQARWEHLNPDLSPLTRLQAVALDAHFGVEQFVRSRAAHLFNFNGTAGVWRRAAIESVGGWQARTLTEDLDLSYRVLLNGWRGLFLRDLTAPAELPPTMSAFRRQQARWAQGSIECALMLAPDILRSNIRLRDKAQAFLHLSGYAIHVLLSALGLFYPLIVLASIKRPDIATLYGAGAVFSLTIFAPTLFFVYGQMTLRRKWWRFLPHIFGVSLVGMGMMMNTLRAAIRALRRGPRVFQRTPKWGVAGTNNPVYYLRRNRELWLETAWGLFNTSVSAYSFTRHQAAIALFAGLFGMSALYVVFFTLLQDSRVAAISPRN